MDNLVKCERSEKERIKRRKIIRRKDSKKEEKITVETAN